MSFCFIYGRIHARHLFDATWGRIWRLVGNCLLDTLFVCTSLFHFILFLFILIFYCGFLLDSFYFLLLWVAIFLVFLKLTEWQNERKECWWWKQLIHVIEAHLEGWYWNSNHALMNEWGGIIRWNTIYLILTRMFWCHWKI